MPAPIDNETARQVKDFIPQFLDCIGLRDGPAHTELKITPYGIRVLETHNRIGGDRLPDLVELTTGLDMYKYSLLWPLGMIDALEEDPHPVGGAATEYFTPRPGIVRNVYGVELCRRNPGVFEIHLPLKPGDTVPALRDTSGRSGYITCVGETSEEARERCSRYMQQITIDTEP